jgi:hypothetical protein
VAPNARGAGAPAAVPWWRASHASDAVNRSGWRGGWRGNQRRERGVHTRPSGALVSAAAALASAAAALASAGQAWPAVMQLITRLVQGVHRVGVAFTACLGFVARTVRTPRLRRSVARVARSSGSRVAECTGSRDLHVAPLVLLLHAKSFPPPAWGAHECEHSAQRALAPGAATRRRLTPRAGARPGCCAAYACLIAAQRAVRGNQLAPGQRTCGERRRAIARTRTGAAQAVACLAPAWRAHMHALRCNLRPSKCVNHHLCAFSFPRQSLF